jgi:pimeloyl-ACP methyl ester carboxylesterase
VKVPITVRAIPALAFRAWLTPPPIGEKTALRDREATADLASFGTANVTGFEVGSGPVALALHGWGGRTAQMGSLARRLAGEGYRVVVPELPGRAGGDQTDIGQAAAAVRLVIDEAGSPDIVIAHSFAAMVMRLAFASDAPPAAVLIAPALDVNDALEVFGDRLGLYPVARRGLRKRLEAWDRALWPKVSSLLPEQMPGTEMLIIHDPSDDETPFARSAELAAIRPGTAIISLDGVGHSRILTDPATLDHVANFAGSRVGSLRSP